MRWLDDVEAKYKRKNKMLFSRDSDCLQELLWLIRQQKHRTLVLWAFECADQAQAILENHCPEETRPAQAIRLCREWSQGNRKMPAAKKALLAAHTAAKEMKSPEDTALCHAVGQACACVHVETHAIGFPIYELTAIVHRYGVENCKKAVEERIDWYINRLRCWEANQDQYQGPWAKFLLDDNRPNKENLLAEKQSQSVRHLFDGWNGAMIWSCLQGHMGYVMTDGRKQPLAAQLVVGDFCFFAGEPDAGLMRKAGAPIIIPRAEEWHPVIEQVWADRVERGTRYSIKKEPDMFDREKLNRFANSLPRQYEMKLIDKERYNRIMAERWSEDLCGQFVDFEDFDRRGIGFVVNVGNVPVAGASSYSIYSQGIEIEIDTREDHRRKGLAAACGARLILECLERGLYPSWDAHDLRSVCLAEKLGYHRDQAYTVYYQKAWK